MYINFPDSQKAQQIPTKKMNKYFYETPKNMVEKWLNPFEKWDA